MSIEKNSQESQILANYLPKLLRLAERNLSNQLRQKVDADEVGATVVRTVVRQARAGKLQIEESDDFWRLLVAITLNKVRKKANYWKRAKRDISREMPVAPDGPQLEELAIDYDSVSSDPTEEQGQAFNDLLERMNDCLDEKCQQVLSAKLQGKSNIQIAEELELSTKTIGRYLKKIQQQLKDLVDEES